MNKQELEAALPWSEGAWKSVDCGEGWYELIAELNQRLLELDPGYTVAQVKEKFGGLRYYASASDYRVLGPVVAEFEGRAAQTCEVCGEPGQQVVTRGWYRTVCEQDT